MRKILFILSLLFLLPLAANAQTQPKKTAVLFYADWCPHCQKVKAYFTQQGFWDKYDIQELNFDDAKNKEILSKIFEAEGQTGGAGIPALIIDDKMIVGDQPIIDGFQNAIENSQGTSVQFVDSFRNDNPTQKQNAANGVPIFVLLSAAFVDASNPCALAVLVLLLATVISAKGKKYALLSGFMFSLAIFISYFLMGIGLYKAIGAVGISKYLSLSVGILAILLALANFKDVFWYGKGFIMEVPLSWRPKMQEIIKKATSPLSAFGIGFVVSLFLVPCASGPYVVILGMLAQKVDTAKTLSLLVLYNLVFVSPMILITLGMYFFNAKLTKIENWRRGHLRWLHAVAGTIMLILGAYLIYTRI